MKNKFNKLKNKLYPSKSFVGVFLSIIILISPILNNKYIRGHDSRFHITNMISTNEYIDISSLNFSLPKIFGGDIARGFGYGTGIFYPPLSYHLTAYTTHILNLKYPNNLLSLPIVEMLIVLLSAISMYIFMKKVFKDSKVAGIGAISYISSTYFLCSIYIRTALAELLTFIFIPLVFLGLYELFFGKEKKFYIPFIIGYIGMVCSQLVIAMYLTAFIILIFIINFRKVFKMDKIKKLIIASIIILLMTSPYLTLLIEHKIFGNYVVFESGSMYTLKSLANNSLEIKHYILNDAIIHPNVQLFINPIVLIVSAMSIVFRNKTFKDNKKIYQIIMILLIITTFMATKYFPWTKMPSIINTLQFPWRLRTFIAFLLAIISGNIIKMFKFKHSNLLIIIIALMITFAGYKNIIRVAIYDLNDYLEKNNNNEWVEGKVDRFTNMGVQKEYLPVNTKYNQDYYYARDHEVIVKKGKAKIGFSYNKIPELAFEVSIDSEEITLELPRLYYLGYKIILTDNNGKKQNIKYYENKYGFIEFTLKDSGLIEVTYEGTIASKISNYIPLLTIVSGLTLMVYKKKKWNFKKHKKGTI